MLCVDFGALSFCGGVRCACVLCVCVFCVGWRARVCVCAEIFDEIGQKIRNGMRI